MPKVLDKPTTEVDPRSATKTLSRPAPPVEAPPRMFRWLGWLLGIGLVAAISWLVIDQITSDEPITATPSYVVTEPGAVTADPKPRTPVVPPPLIGEVTFPGEVSLTELSRIGRLPSVATYVPPARSALPGVYWSPRVAMDADSVFPDGMTMTPGMYWPVLNQPDWTLDTYELTSTVPTETVEVPTQSVAAPASHGGHLTTMR